MPQRLPAIGEDVSHLFGDGNAAPAIGEDVSHLFEASRGLYDPNRKPASTEDFAPQQRDVSVGNVLWNAVKSIPGGIVDAVETAYNDHRPEDAALGPAGVLAPLIRSAASGAKAEAGKTVADIGRGRYSEAAGHAAATALPLVGPAAAQAGEDIGSGETERIERGGGAAIAMLGSAVAPRVIPRVAPPLASIGEQVLAKGKALPQAVARATSGIHPLVLDIAGEVAGHALGAQLGVPTLARRVLAHVLGDATKAAPEASKAGGRLVKAAVSPSIEDALATALEELRAPASTRVELPPQPTLPPGYTPRATAPKAAPDLPSERRAMPRVADSAEDALYTRYREKLARGESTLSPSAKAEFQRKLAVGQFRSNAAAARGETPLPRVSEPPANPQAVPTNPQPAGQRAYFLKPVEELSTVADDAVTPSGSINPEDLPAAWRKHTGQDLFPVTGEEGKAVAAALKAELKDRGVSVGEAMARVSKNKNIPTRERAQLIKALSQAYVQR